MQIPPLTRRRFLGTSAAATAALFTPKLHAAEAAEFSFFVLGDTHYLADKNAPDTLDAVSAATNAGLLKTVNALRGTAIPEAARAGNVGVPRGVIHLGDLTDSGLKTGPEAAAMQRTEMNAWLAGYGLNGEGGALQYPVYEVHGNHDGTQGDGLIVPKIMERNRQRAGLAKVSANGLHYSWDWGAVHFVCLGLIVGTDKTVARKRRYAALDSLDFLIADLAEKVGDSGRPVVLVHHVDLARYSLPLDAPAPEAKEWDPADVHAFYEAIKGYRVAAIFYGHTHTRTIFRWDGLKTKGVEGIPVFNCDNSAHFSFDEQSFFHVTVNERELLVREHRSEDRWETAAWTPQSWSVPLGKA